MLAAEIERRERERVLHRWVADGQVEHRRERRDADTYFTEYRVVGGGHWVRECPRHAFPSEKLIARLALDIHVFQPPVKPIPPNWAAAWGLEFPRRSAIVCDGATT